MMRSKQRSTSSRKWRLGACAPHLATEEGDRLAESRASLTPRCCADRTRFGMNGEPCTCHTNFFSFFLFYCYVMLLLRYVTLCFLLFFFYCYDRAIYVHSTCHTVLFRMIIITTVCDLRTSHMSDSFFPYDCHYNRV